MEDFLRTLRGIETQGLQGDIEKVLAKTGDSILGVTSLTAHAASGSLASPSDVEKLKTGRKVITGAQILDHDYRKTPVAQRLGALAVHSSPSVHLVRSSSEQKDSLTQSLVDEILHSSNLLNETSHLPPHLLTFKRDFERFQTKRIKLPTIHQQLTPRTKRRISQLPPSSVEEESAVDKYVSMAKAISGSQAYENLTKVATKSRIKSQQSHLPEDHVLKQAKEALQRSKLERILMPLPVLADLGLSQEQLTRHDSTAFFDKLEDKRKHDTIKASISSRFAPTSDSDCKVVQEGGEHNNERFVPGNYLSRSISKSELKDILERGPGSRSTSPISGKLEALGSNLSPNEFVNDEEKSALERELYGMIRITNERGQSVYDERGSLRASSLKESYSEVFQEASSVGTGITTRYASLQEEARNIRARGIAFKRTERNLLDDIKIRCYDELGLDLDARFTAVRIASKAVNMMMFYMIEVRLKGSFLKLKEQTRLASVARRETAAALINRVARGMLARAETREMRRLIFLARELERRTAESRQTARRKAAQCITRSLRLYGKMRILRLNRRRRIAATSIQRRVRGRIGRIRVNRLRNWNDWLRSNSIRIQCAFRQHLARRRVCLLRKILVVRSWESQNQAERSVKDFFLRQRGAAAFIIHCYRAYKIKYKLKIIIHWHRFELTIVLQKWVRGYFDRKMVKRIKKRKLDREKIIREAAVAIQKIVRGRQARKNVYKPLLAKKVRDLISKRTAKAKYMKEATKNNALRVLYGTLRTFMPFRYVILRWKATLIQRVYRGHRGRKRVFLMKIRAAITKMNRKYFGGYNGALQLQRLYRGYRYRRDKLKAKRRAATVIIQCAFRCSQARWAVIQKKVRRDAMLLVGRNIAVMMRFKKAQRIRRENRRYKHIVIKIQRFARRYLGRLRFQTIKTDKRSLFERAKVNDLRLNHILASIQLRIIMESIERPLGEQAESVYGIDCYARGPIHAVFCAAVGKKARIETAALPTNKLDSGSLLKFALKVKGMLENGRPAKEEFDDLYKAPKFLEGDEDKSMLKSAGGQGSRLAQGKGKTRSPGPGRGKRQRTEKVKIRSTPPGQFALIDALRSEGISVIEGVNRLSKLDLEMFFAKSRQEGEKELRYFDFVHCVDLAAKHHYGCVADEDKSVSSEIIGVSTNPQIPNSESGEAGGDSISIGTANDSSVLSDDAEDGYLGPTADTDVDGEEFSQVTTAAAHAMKERRREAKLKKRATAGKDVSKAKASVKDGKLLWPLKEITSKSRPNYKVLLLLKMIDSLRNQEWWLDLAEWMELESRARVGVYVKRMQNLFWHMKSAAFRALMRDRIGARLRMEEYNCTVVVIQSWVRRFICKARVQHAAQVFLVKYIPDVGEPYWYNPSTRVTSKVKPLVLGPYDCLSIALPPPGLEFVVQCSNCALSAVINCWECEDSYCKKCYDNLHCKGKRRMHHYFPIPKCGYCKFQVASKCCVTCITIKPEPGSAQEQMKESDRGSLCDYCFTHLHDENELMFDHDGQAEKKLQQRQIFARSREAYLIKHQLRKGILTDHKFDFLVQECEECNIRAASWRCGDCKQIYCNTCLVGLHSLGGPFSSHRAEKLPFYTREMHQSFLMDQRTQIFQHKMEVVKRAWEQRAEAYRFRSIVRIQAWWRMIFHGLRRGRLIILKGRKKERRAWRLRRTEMPIRNSIKYKFLDLFGLAPALLSDTHEEQVLKQLTIFGKQFAREYIWKNRDSFGFYTSSRGKSNCWKKGDPKRGFDVGKIEELHQQARRGGFRMPGLVFLKQGETKHTTSHDLRDLVKNGMLVRVGGAYFMVRHVSENSIRLDRIWRWESVPDGVVCYRLPAYSDETRRIQFKALYYLSNFAISNPVSQSYFNAHYNFFDNLKGVAEYIERVHKNLGFRRGSMEWRRYAQKLEKRATWAQDLLDDTGSLEATDLSKQKSVKDKASGGGGAVAAALQAAAESGEIKLPEVDSDDEGTESDKPKERALGERWFATEAELAARLAAEAAMSTEDLIATHNLWEECIDPMSENIFWTNKITFEMVADMPAALKAKIAKETKEAEDKKNQQEALAKINAAKGLNAHGKKKTGVGMSGKR